MITTATPILEQLKKIIAQELKVTVNQVTLEAHLTRDFSIDQTGLSELLLVIEQEFKVSFLVDEENKLTTVSSLFKLLEKSLVA